MNYVWYIVYSDVLESDVFNQYIAQSDVIENMRE